MGSTLTIRLLGKINNFFFGQFPENTSSIFRSVFKENQSYQRIRLLRYILFPAKNAENRYVMYQVK